MGKATFTAPAPLVAALPAERGTCAEPRSAANKVKSTRLLSLGGSLWGQEQPKAMSCQAGSPVLCATLAAQYTPPLNVLLQWHRSFWMCAILCSVHTPMTTEVHVRADRNSHTLEGCRGCVNFLAPVCLPCSTITGTTEHEEL